MRLVGMAPVVAGLLAGCLAVGAEPLVAVVVPEGAPPPNVVVERLLVRCPGWAPPAGHADAWPLVDLFGPLPDEAGRDLLRAHPEWLMADAEGAASLPGTPCYGLPEVRAARAAQIAALARAGAQGVCLSALPRPDWPADVNVARGYGFSAPLVEAFRERYGRDPREAPEGSVDRALFAGLKSEAMADLLAQIRALAPDLRLALACAEADLLPHSATGAALDVPGYIAAGLLDEVMVAARGPINFLGLKLHTDGPLRVWAWQRAEDAEGFAAQAAVAARSIGADGVVVDVPGDAAGAVAALHASLRRHAERLEAQQRLREEVEAGALKAVAGTELAGPVDQATIHGVAQGFQVAEPMQVHAVGIVATLRGPAGPALPPLVLSIRADDGGKPGGEALGSATLGPEDFLQEPAYQWGYGRLDRPVNLEPGRLYWLHAPDTQAAGSSYVWRTHKGDAYPHGHAWSGIYDYSHIDWVFTILTRTEATP